MNEEITPETVERVKTFRELLTKMCLSQEQCPVIMTSTGALVLIAGIDDDANVIVFKLTKGEWLMIDANTLISRRRDNPKHIPVTPP